MPVIGYLEDDPVIRENFVDLLESDGYSVIAHDTLSKAENDFTRDNIDLALLDVELGDNEYGGLELCKSLRKKYPDIPIIFLTSHTHIDIQSRGWRLGADDYVTKDTHLELVLLRVRALLKRYAMLKVEYETHGKNGETTDGLKLDETALKAMWKNSPLDLSLTQYWLLASLFKNNGQVIGHEDLQKAANIYVEPNTIVAHIKNIRDEFKKIDPSFACIKTERGHGYRWVEG